jgi:hypothetical protein
VLRWGLQEFKPRSAALLHALLNQQQQQTQQQQQQQDAAADSIEPSAKKQRTGGNSSKSSSVQPDATAAADAGGSSSSSSGSSIGLLLPPGGLHGMLNPHLLLLVNELCPSAGVLSRTPAAAAAAEHPSSSLQEPAVPAGAKRKRPAAAAAGEAGSSSSPAVAVPAGRHVSSQLTEQQLFGMLSTKHSRAVPPSACDSNSCDGNTQQQQQQGEEAGWSGWPDGLLPVMWAALPLLPDAASAAAAPAAAAAAKGAHGCSSTSAAAAGAAAGGVLQPGLSAVVQVLFGASGGRVSLRPAAAQTCTWLVSSQPLPAEAPARDSATAAAAAAAGAGGAPATSQTSGSSSSPQRHQQAQAQQQQQQDLVGDRSETYLRVLPWTPSGAGDCQDQLFRCQELQLGLQLQLILPQQPLQQQDVPKLDAAAAAEPAAAEPETAAAAAAAAGTEPFLCRSFNMEMLYGPGAPEADLSKPQPPRRYGKGGRSRAKAAAAAAATEACKLPVLLPGGRCPFCWQMFGSVAALAAHMRVSHDRLGCCCPDDSSIQVRFCLSVGVVICQ